MSERAMTPEEERRNESEEVTALVVMAGKEIFRVERGRSIWIAPDADPVDARDTLFSVLADYVRSWHRLDDRCRVLEERNAELAKQRDASDSERLDVVERCIKAEARVASLAEDARRLDWLAKKGAEAPE